MTDFKNAIIFGLAVENSLNELTVDPNTALRNLNLIPADFNKLRRIGSDSAGIGKTFQRLSGLNENLLLKLDSLKSETREYDGVLDEIYEARARRSRRQKIQPIQGNLNVNGKLSGRTVSYRVFDEETSSFKTVPITTAINSAWDELGTSIFLGSSLKIASTNASPGNPLVKTGKLKNLQTFTQRRFLAEKATHKIAIKVDGVQYYMYAIKNNPFVFTGNFKNIVGESADNDANILLTVSDSSTINFENPNPHISYAYGGDETRNSEYLFEYYYLIPQPGDLIIFPSWLKHGSMYQKNGTVNRTCISFNTK